MLSSNERIIFLSTGTVFWVGCEQKQTRMVAKQDTLTSISRLDVVMRASADHPTTDQPNQRVAK